MIGERFIIVIVIVMILSMLILVATILAIISDVQGHSVHFFACLISDTWRVGFGRPLKGEGRNFGSISHPQ